MPENKVETLAQYVTRIIKEKGLKHHEVSQRSGREITDGYIRGIMTGRASNPSVKKLQALARGLSVDEDEIFRVARGLPPGKGKPQHDESDYQSIAAMLVASMKDPVAIELLSELLRLSRESLEDAGEALKFLNSHKDQSSRPKKKR